MRSPRGTRVYLHGWLDALLSLTDIHLNETKKMFYSCDEYSMLDLRDRDIIRFTFSDKGDTSKKEFTYADIAGVRANHGEGIFSVVLKDGFCCKLRMWASDSPMTKKYVSFTIGDLFTK